MHRFLLILIFSNFVFPVFGDRWKDMDSRKDQYDLGDYMQVFATHNPDFPFSSVLQQNFIPYHKASLNSDTPIHWVRFFISNNDSIDHDLRISIAFTDLVSFYSSSDGRTFIKKETGDLTPIEDRDVNNGKLVFISLKLLKGERKFCYLKLQSTTDISQEFRIFALNSLRVYNEKAFAERFETSRIYQSFFYGAILIMLFFNLFIFLRIKSASYIYYVFYLACLALFFSSNDGYLAELFFSHFPRIDLFIRFISAPLLLFSYLLFARAFLQAKDFAPGLAKTINVFFILLGISVLVMVTGSWYWGRNLVIYTILLSFPFILYLAINILRRGFTPARYFLAGNILLIIGALIFAVPRLVEVQQNPFMQYSLQIAALFEVAFFSIGLADRISMMQKKLSEAVIEREVQERKLETERKKIIEEKNKELEKLNQELNTYIYKTAHDIKGPIARLRGLCKVALMEVKESTAVDYLQKLDYNSSYLNYIINRLSVIYDINNIEVQKENIRFDRIIQEVENYLKAFDEFKKVSYGVEIDKGIHFSSDQKLLEHILINLAENALKFQNKNIDNGIISIRIKMESDNLLIVVYDNGIGVPKENIPGLFEMFTKAAGRHQTPGLGLYMAKLCVGKLKGKIECNSEEGVFTEFVIRIPQASTL